MKRMRGSSGYCRAHGGGPLCSVRNCDKFARLSGRCSFHGGYARCVEVGCEEVPCSDVTGPLSCLNRICRMRLVYNVAM